MSRIVKIEDFEKGKLKISTTAYIDGDLQQVIDNVEENTLRDLLGKALYDLFVVDWDAQPNPPTGISARFEVIYKPIYDYDQCPVIKSKGMKDMLMNLIYFEFVQKQQFENRVTGTNKTKNENSENVSPSNFGLQFIYNDGIESYVNIQRYIDLNLSTYPEYKGISKDYISWL